GGGRGGYLVMGAVTALLIGAGMAAAALLTTRPGVVGPESTAPVASSTGARVTAEGAAPSSAAGAGYGAGWAALRESAPLRALLATFVLQALATGAMLAAAQYVATYTLGDESAVTFLFAALVAPALLVMPLARRF